MVNSKATKAELFAYVEQLEQQLAAEKSPVIGWKAQAQNLKARFDIHQREFNAAVIAARCAGNCSRVWMDGFISEMSQPIFKA